MKHTKGPSNRTLRRWNQAQTKATDRLRVEVQGVQNEVVRLRRAIGALTLKLGELGWAGEWEKPRYPTQMKAASFQAHTTAHSHPCYTDEELKRIAASFDGTQT